MLNLFWKAKWGIAALALLVVGWFILNIWVVGAGAVAAVYATSSLQRAIDIPLKWRILLIGAMVAILTALHIVYGNKDMLLAAGIIVVMCMFIPWAVHRIKKSD